MKTIWESRYVVFQVLLLSECKTTQGYRVFKQHIYEIHTQLHSYVLCLF